MSDDLIEDMATAMSPTLFGSKPDSEVGPGTRAARDRLRENARTALRVLAEHGDTQQVRERVAAALWTAFREDSGFVEAVMAVVTPIGTELHAAKQQLDQLQGLVNAALEIHTEHVTLPSRVENSCVCVACRMARVLDGTDETRQQ